MAGLNHRPYNGASNFSMRVSTPAENLIARPSGLTLGTEGALSGHMKPQQKEKPFQPINRRTFVKALPVLTVLASTGAVPGEEGAKTEAALETIQLPAPETDGGRSVLAALKERRTNRNISDRELPKQVLSNLLWAAFGVNRQQGSFGKPGRTAPSASNSQEIDLYIALPSGVYLYEAVPHHLKPVVAGDFRSRSGRGAAISAPVNIFYVVDLTKYDTGPTQPDRRIGDPEVQKSYYYTDTGLIAANVYLFAASQGLAAWFHNCNKEGAATDFKLGKEQRVLFAQTVGYPA
jgi:nitroreductase